jgi:hypothetical protein
VGSCFQTKGLKALDKGPVKKEEKEKKRKRKWEGKI